MTVSLAEKHSFISYNNERTMKRMVILKYLISFIKVVFFLVKETRWSGVLSDHSYWLNLNRRVTSLAFSRRDTMHSHSSRIFTYIPTYVRVKQTWRFVTQTPVSWSIWLVQPSRLTAENRSDYAVAAKGARNRLIWGLIAIINWI